MNCSTHIAYEKLQYSHSEIWMLFLVNPKLLKDFLIDRWGGITVFSQGPSFLVWHDLGLMEDWPPWCLPPSSSRHGAGADWQNSMGGKRRCANSPPMLYLMFLTKASISPTPLPNIAQPASTHPGSGTNRLWNPIVRMLGTDAQTLGMMRRVRLYSKIKCQRKFSRSPRNWTVVSKHLLAIDRRLLGACFLWYINSFT